MDNKHYFLLFTSLLLGVISGVSQENGDVQNLYKTELDKMVKVPVSPEAGAFMQYGDTKVSLYSGVPQISVPLHALEGREFSLPITLTYDASGIKVEQLATWVGLGWNLNVGGRVTRMANGLADDYIQGDYASITTSTTLMTSATVINRIAQYKNSSSNFSSASDVQDYFDFLYDISRNFIDAEPDYYQLNAPGISATIVMDIEDNNKLKALNNPRIKILRYSNGWEVTNEDGTVYEFLDKSETTLKHGNDDVPNGAIINEFESSWLLTKITSPNGKDVYVFNYTDFGYWAQEQLGSSAQRVTNNFIDNLYVYPIPTPQYGSGTGYWVKQQFLTSILHNGSSMMSTNMGVRHDIDVNATNTRLSSIDFFDLEGNDLKSIEFDNAHYFNLDGGDPAVKNRFDIRLKLDGITIKGKQNGINQNYEFTYQTPDNLPPRDSNAQDYFGYYNGQSNSSLIPRFETGNYIFHGANREPDAVYGKIGMLTRITYPTKGYTEFEYEGHDIYRTETVQSTVNYLDIGLTGTSVTDGNLYYDDNGQPCDDRFLDNSLPKILFKVFTIPETDSYDILYTANGETEGYIMYLGPIDETTCGTGPNGTVICPSPNDTFENYCDVYGSSSTAHWLSTTSYNGPMAFDAGVYKAMIVLDENSQGNYGTVDLQVTRDEQAINSGNHEVGGIRIKEIRDYSGPSELARTKLYSYRDDQDKSTGYVNFQPILSTIKSFNTSTNPVTQLVRTATFPKGDEPYVVYPRVREYLLDDQGNSEGYTVHSFHRDPKGAVPRMTLPFENNYYGNLKASQLIQQTQMDTNDNVISKQDIDFYQTSTGHVSMNGWVYYTEEGNSDKRVAIKEFTSGGNTYYGYQYVLNFECQGTTFCPIPPYISNPQAYGYESILNEKYSALKGRSSFVAGAYGGVSSVVDSLYLKDANNNPLEVVTTKETTYDATVDYLPRTARTVDSEGEVFESINYYPKDNIVTGSSNLISKNRLSELVKSETFKDPDATTPVKIQAMEKEYTSNGVYVLPSMVRTQKGETSTLDRVAFTYHSNGNLKEANVINGPTTTYVWGYGDRYPVAVVSNASQSDINGVNLNMVLVNDAATSDGSMRTELDKLRTNLNNAMVTTYTYDPLVGVTSITDPSGQTSYYIYDEHNRLKEVRDRHNNLVTDYKYHYKGQ